MKKLKKLHVEKLRELTKSQAVEVHGMSPIGSGGGGYTKFC